MDKGDEKRKWEAGGGAYDDASGKGKREVRAVARCEQNKTVLLFVGTALPDLETVSTFTPSSSFACLTLTRALVTIHHFLHCFSVSQCLPSSVLYMKLPTHGFHQ